MYLGFQRDLIAQTQVTSSFDKPGMGTFSDIAWNLWRKHEEHTLALLGKRQVLKVTLGFQVLIDFLTVLKEPREASIWISVALRAQLCHSSDMGNGIGVSKSSLPARKSWLKSFRLFPTSFS